MRTPSPYKPWSTVDTPLGPLHLSHPAAVSGGANATGSIVRAFASLPSQIPHLSRRKGSSLRRHPKTGDRSVAFGVANASARAASRPTRVRYRFPRTWVYSVVAAREASSCSGGALGAPQGRSVSRFMKLSIVRRDGRRTPGRLGAPWTRPPLLDGAYGLFLPSLGGPGLLAAVW